MKKLTLKTTHNSNLPFIDECLQCSSNENDFIQLASAKIENLAIEFYNKIGEIFDAMGLNVIVTREGDVNCRFDATLVDNSYSIPIEIKSPREDFEINIKAIRQAFENKIILLSRNFYNTTPNTTSLAIAFTYPPLRSDVYELIEDIKSAFGFNIGIVNVADLLRIVYQIKANNKQLNFDYFNSFIGKFDYEKAIY